MAISGGTCPTVGIAGLCAGGGLGVLSRRHGLTCDRLLEVEMVIADGRLVRADARHDEGLHWATRGGGGGNFGIVTALTFALVPVDMPFTYATYRFPWRAAERLLVAWQEWLPTSPRRTSSDVALETRDPRHATPAVELEVVHAGPERELHAVVRELLGAVGVAPSRRTLDAGPFVDVEGDFYCKGLRPRECRIAGLSPAGQFPRLALYAKSDVAAGPWPREGLRALTESIEKRQRDRILTPREFSATHDVGKVLIEGADGAVNSIAPNATAFVHRDNLFVTQFQARWSRGAPPGVVEANLEWAGGLYAAVEPYRSGFAYQNYIDADLDDWEHAYYGANLPRLRELKSRYDPGELFSFAQSIPPA
jgi:FAD/FMN-containing dehydrogenase